MELESSLPHSQVPATGPYPELPRLSPYPTFHFLKIHLNIILPSTPGTSKWFPHQKTLRLFSPPYMLHAPPISFFSISSPEQYCVSSTDH